MELTGFGEDVSARYDGEVLSTRDELEGIESDWNRLSECASHPNVFSTHAWFSVWSKQGIREVGPDRFQPSVFVLRDRGKIVAIAPLVRRVALGVFPVRKLAFVTHHADYNDLALGMDAAVQIEGLAQFLALKCNSWDMADLRDLRGPEQSIKDIGSALRRAGLFYRILPETYGCPYMAIDSDAAGAMMRLSGHVRRTLHKRRERAREMGLRMRIIENPQQEEGLLEKLIALDWLKHLHRSSPTFVGAYPEVFQSLFEMLGPRGWLYLALIELGDHPVAFQLGFRCGRKLWDYTKAYDRSFSRVAPGTLLVQDLVDYGFENNFEEYDFLRGEEEYKTVWSTGCHRQYRLVIWNRRWLSRICAFAYLKLRVNSFEP